MVAPNVAAPFVVGLLLARSIRSRYLLELLGATLRDLTKLSGARGGA